MINYFCCYVIKLAGQTTKKVLLSVIWNTLFIEINLYQIRTLDIKREKVHMCGVHVPFISFSCRLHFPCLQSHSRLLPLQDDLQGECTVTESPIFFKLCEIKVSLCNKEWQRHTTHYSEILEKTALKFGKIFAAFHIPCFVPQFSRFDVAERL